MAITATERTQIIELTVLMFNAAPGATYLDQILEVYEQTGENLQTLATILADTPAYKSINPDTQTAAEFATAFLTPLGLQDDALAVEFITTQLANGASKGAVAYAAYVALNEVAIDGAPQYVRANAILNNKTVVSEIYSVGLAVAETDLAALQTVVASVTDDATTLDEAIDAIANPGATFSLTTGTDTFIGTAQDDVITAAAGTLQAGDLIIDESSTDSDVMNITATAATPAATITNVETVNVDWNAFGTATIDADNITGATITGTSSKVGFLGSMTVNNAGANTIVAGAGMDGTLTVNGATKSVVNAGASVTVSVTSAGSTADDTLALVADSATSVTVADFNSATVSAAVATTISLTDDDGAADDGDTASLTFGKSASLTNAVDDLTVTASAADLTLTVDAIGASLDVAGTNDVTINIAAATDFTGETMTKSSAGTVTLNIEDIDGASDLDGVVADLITVEAASIGGALTVKSGQRVQATSDLGAAYGLTVAGAGTADTATLVLDDSQSSAITFTGVETATIEANAEVSTTAVDLTIAQIAAGTKDVVLTGANDVTISSIAAGELDASALTNNLIVTQTGDAAMDILGGSANNTVTFKGTTVDNNYVGQDGKDIVTFATTTANATATIGSGTNSVTADSLTTGTLVVTGGSGNDSVSVAGLTTGTVVAELGDGTNSVTFGATGNLGDANITITTGSGNDTVTVADDTAAGTVLTVSLGAGTNTLSLGKDMTAGTISIDGLTTIAIGANAATAVVNATLLNGKGYTVTGQGTVTDLLKVEFDAAGTGDFSGIVIDNTLTKGLGGLDVTGTAAKQTIVGTSAADTIDGAGGGDSITGGAGVDTMTANGGDTFVFASGHSGTTTTTADSIAGFTSASDKLDFNLAAGSVTNYVEVAGAAASMAAVKTAADAAMDGTVLYYLGNAGGNGYLFVDMNGDGTADLGVILTGVTDIAATDIIA